MATKKTPATDKAPSEIRAISWARIFGSLTPEKIGSHLELCKIAGEVSDIQEGVNDNGSWSCFVGEFAATNLETGEIFISSRAFVPGARGENMKREFESQLKNDARSKMQFAVIVFAEPRKDDAEKFNVEAKSLIENKFANKALTLLSKI